MERKSWHDTETHFTNRGVAREGQLHEWFRRISRDRIELQWEMFSRSQSRSSHSKSSFHAKPRQTLVTWYMEFVWTTGKLFWQSSPYVRFITDTLSRNSSLCDSKCHRRGSSARKYRDTCRKRWRTNWQYDNNADVWKKAVNHEFLFAGGNPTECYGWTAKTTDIGASVW